MVEALGKYMFSEKLGHYQVIPIAQKKKKTLKNPVLYPTFDFRDVIQTVLFVNFNDDLLLFELNRKSNAIVVLVQKLKSSHSIVHYHLMKLEKKTNDPMIQKNPFVKQKWTLGVVSVA